MTIVLIAVLILACFLLGLVILIQNPKGGGLGSIGGVNTSLSNQFGVQHTTNILEKGTYIIIGVIALLSIVSIYISSPPASAVDDVDKLINMPVTGGGNQIAPPASNQAEPTLVDTTKKP